MNDKADLHSQAETPAAGKSKKATAMQFLLRGLAITLPSVLTLVILLWIGRGIYDYIINPVSTAVQWSIALVVEESLPTSQFEVLDQPPSLEYCEKRYRVTKDLKADLPDLIKQYDTVRGAVQTDNKQTTKIPAAVKQKRLDQVKIPAAVIQKRLDQVYVPLGDDAVPYDDYAAVAAKVGSGGMPTSAIGVYMELVTTRYFRSLFNLSAVAVLLAIVFLYFTGRIVTARLGGWVVGRFETLVMGRLPVVSNVYSSVKQVTDFLFTERTVSYNRVVAVEYPRRGMWSVGFVTSDSLLEITVAAGEPLVSVLMPTSPMPMTGFTVSLPRSEVVDLNITIDQAFQFCLSCGVLVPAQQKVTPELLQKELARRLADTTSQMIQTENSSKKFGDSISDSESDQGGSEEVS